MLPWRDKQKAIPGRKAGSGWTASAFVRLPANLQQAAHIPQQAIQRGDARLHITNTYTHIMIYI